MYTIFDVFTPKAETFYLTEDMSVLSALEKFDQHKFSVVPVINKNGAYITTVSQGDILRFIKRRGEYDSRILDRTGIMQLERYRPYQACRHSERIEEVLRLGLQQSFVPIVDDIGTYIGIVKRKSIIEQVLGSR